MSLKDKLGDSIVPIDLSKYKLNSHMYDKKQVIWSDKLAKQLGSSEQDCLKSYEAFRLFQHMINHQYTIWLGIAGIASVEGFGKMFTQLTEQGFIDIACSTGAQIYHDLHYAYDLPIKRIDPNLSLEDDKQLDNDGLVRIHDVVIKDEETLLRQDEIIGEFVIAYQDKLIKYDKETKQPIPISCLKLTRLLGEYVLETAPSPEQSFVAACAKYDVPLFWDSTTNHSIAMKLSELYLKKGIDVRFNTHLDIILSAALVYCEEKTGFFELGGGGPKNFIQQTSPTLSQMYGLEQAKGADAGLQITTALESDGGLSGCTFSEAITWGKYVHGCEESKIMQIPGDYRTIAPLTFHTAHNTCKKRPLKRLNQKLKDYLEILLLDSGSVFDIEDIGGI